MKKIFPLNISRLTNKQHFTYMQLAVAACTLYAIISEEFRRLFEALVEAFEHENDVFERIDRTFITDRLQKADAERIRLFRHMRDYIKTYETCEPGAKKDAADILMKIVALYGGGKITGIKADERSAAIFNLVEDYEKVYQEQVEELGCGDMVSALKTANQAYLDIVTERAQFDSEFGMKMMATARKQTDEVYHALVSSVNAAALVDNQGRLTPFIDYMNVNVRRYRGYIGQSTADMDGGTSSGGSGSGSGESGLIMKNATFEFVGGNSQKFRLEVGAPLEALANTLGYKWKPEVPEFMPNKNIVFREVPVVDKEAVAMFHFFDHREEEIRQLVGSVLNAPANSPGYVWDPAVPATMPDGDTSYYEMPVSGEGGSGEGSGSGSGSGTGSGGTGTGGTGGGSGEPRMVRADFFYLDGTEYNMTGEPGTRLIAPEPDSGNYWEPTPPMYFPDHDTEYHEVEGSGEGDGDDDAGFGR